MSGLNRAFKRRPSMVAMNGGPVLCLDAGSKLSYPGTGTTWTDLSGNGNNGTLTNGPTYDSANGGSIVFDGVNDYATAATAYSMFNFGTGNFSMFMWIKCPASSNYRTIASLDDTSSGNGIVFYGTPTTGYLRTWVANSVLNGSVSVCTNNWVNVGIVRNTGVVTHYINGVGSGSFNSAGSLLANQTLALASNTSGGPGGYSGFVGNISNVNIYNRALSATEIATNFELLRGRYGI